MYMIDVNYYRNYHCLPETTRLKEFDVFLIRSKQSHSHKTSVSNVRVSITLNNIT